MARMTFAHLRRKLLVFILGRWRDRYIRCQECSLVFDNNDDGQLGVLWHYEWKHQKWQ